MGYVRKKLVVLVLTLFVSLAAHSNQDELPQYRLSISNVKFESIQADESGYGAALFSCASCVNGQIKLKIVPESYVVVFEEQFYWSMLDVTQFSTGSVSYNPANNVLFVFNLTPAF